MKPITIMAIIGMSVSVTGLIGFYVWHNPEYVKGIFMNVNSKKVAASSKIAEPEMIELPPADPPKQGLLTPKSSSLRPDMIQVFPVGAKSEEHRRNMLKIIGGGRLASSDLNDTGKTRTETGGGATIEPKKDESKPLDHVYKPKNGAKGRRKPTTKGFVAPEVKIKIKL